MEMYYYYYFFFFTVSLCLPYINWGSSAAINHLSSSLPCFISNAKLSRKPTHETIFECSIMLGVHIRLCLAFVNTFVSLHSWVLALRWANSRMIGPVIVCEGPGAGGGQGAGPLSSLLERDTVQTRAGAAARAGAGAGDRAIARGRAGGRDSSRRGTVHGCIFVRAGRRGSVLPVTALISPLLICITICVHCHRSVSLQNRSTDATYDFQPPASYNHHLYSLITWCNIFKRI